MEPRNKRRKTVGLKQKERSQWCKGTLCPIRKENSIFIKPLDSLPEGYTNKDVFMHSDNISKYVLRLKCGDSVEFVLGDRDKVKPMARKVKVSQYSQRTCEELVDYIKKFTEDLHSADCKVVLMETLSNTVMWSFLGSPVFDKRGGDPATVRYIEALLSLLKLILRLGKDYKTLVEEMIKTVAQGMLFKATNDESLPKMIKSCRYVADRDVFYFTDTQTLLSTELIRSFCRDVIGQVPSVSRCLLPTVSAINEKIPSPSTQTFLFEFISLALSGESTMVGDEGVWQELPFIPTDHELAGHLVEKDAHLSPVKNSYVDAENYMDTYYRLLRAETFSAIQHGIKNLKACELDERDMNVYHNIHLAGFDIQTGRFSLAVHFTPARAVKKWEASPQLMFGNLVCISLNRKFDDVIWATVSNRDADLLNKHQVIMLELLDENTKKMSEIISSLQAHAGSGVMVESPTYYHAFNPVLRSLKAFDIENFPLQREVIHSRPTTQLPNYLQQANTVNTSPIYKNDSRSRYRDWEMSGNDIINGEMEFKRFLEIFNENSSTSLEASQCEALKQALVNRLAIIQGPPGCGKTFIGVKIVQLLLSLSPKLEKPILLLTYKNHALDEFLKHMLEFCRKDELVRIGGRSKEPELESCNLQSVIREMMKNKSFGKAMFAEIQETRNEIDDVEARIKELSSEVDASSHLTQSSFISELSEEQLRSLLVEAAWGKQPLVHRVNNRTFANKAWVETLVDSIAKDFGSLSAFLLLYLSKAVPQNDQNAANCFSLFNKSFQTWFPDRQDLRHMKEFQAEFVLQIRSEKTERGGASNAPDNGDDQDSGDEEHVKELLEKRMASSFKQGARSKDGLVLFKSVKNNNKDVLIEISDYPGDMQVGPQIRSVVNLWNLNKIERLQFLYCILNEKTSSTSEEFDQLIEKLEILKNRKEELEMNKKVELLSQKKIIGVTITGASINHDLIHHIGPSVVIVEEAAEILEPSLLAALTPSIEHLILIGDHKQLRPQVDTYDLCRNFHFDKSMMERLIDAKFPFKSLTKQNRMLPEFSALLHDIYPNLEDNLDLVLKNEPLKCIGKSMFFWSHNYPEKHDRTYTNVKEAERVIALVLYLLWSDCRPSEITVLAAYLGQTKLLRNMLKQAKAKHPQLFQETLASHDDDDNGVSEGFVQVQTIDMYQGDENKYVLISLVRSNENNKIGFLNQMNRRCVAQSRAKCGMYFVGNLNVLREARESRWYRMINSMISQECAEYAIPLQCTKHTTSRYDAVEGDEIYEIIATPKRLCQRSCGDPYPCGIHCCKRSCLPRHHHGACVEIVDDVFPGCGHPVKRRCPQDISQLLCKKEVRVVLRCRHETMKQCHQRACDILCDELVPATFPQCGHKTEKKCYVKIEDMSCSHPCEKMNSCGKHRCVSNCGKPHGHDSCQIKIDYKFPGCNHPSPKKKKCSEAITWPCTYTVYFKGSCGHPIKKQCHQNNTEIKCPVKPCEKKRKCGHSCTNACGDDCEKGDCKLCQDIHKEKMKKFHEAAKKKMQDLEDKIRTKVVPTFSIDAIFPTGSTAAEYQKVNDLVTKFIQPMHNWFPKVTKIEKVTNLVLEQKFEEAKSKAFGYHIDSKFHGTSNDGVTGITKDGFRMPNPNPPPDKRGMYGQGIYFATDSSKSARTIYTKGSQKLLLCQVILGRSKTVRHADYTLNKQKLKSHGYDSVYAPRGTDVINDEFVIFDPDQALPQYIIHFSDTNTVVPPSPAALTTQPITVQKMQPSRAVNFQDPFQMYYNFAECHFRRMAAKGNPPLSSQKATITSIDVVINKDLENKFEATRQKFKSRRIPSQEILAYHGTPSGNIDSILKTNLKLSYARRQAYGRGNYFSEYPAVSLDYGDGLLLCRILPGKEYVNSGPGDIPQGYDSKKVLLSAQPAGAAAAAASGEMIIIENSDQILPFFVIHRR